MKYRSQPRIPGMVRESTYSALLPQIRQALDALARRHKVKRSWVAATLLAKALRISEQPDFESADDTRARTRKERK